MPDQPKVATCLRIEWQGPVAARVPSSLLPGSEFHREGRFHPMTTGEGDAMPEIEFTLAGAPYLFL